VPLAAEWKWHLPVESILGAEDAALIIDLKPNQREERPSLYQIRDIWGYSCDGWTPIMLRLRGLSVDGKPQLAHWDDFVATEDSWGAIYTFLFLGGDVKDRQLIGRWTPTSPSPTNSLLLFPHLMVHFTGIIRANDPVVLAAG
jgi:hypothetical protein